MSAAGTDAIQVSGIQLRLPAGWEDRTVATVVGPTIDGAQVNVVVTREALCSNLGLGGYSSGWVRKLNDQIPVEEHRSVEHIEIAGEPAHLRLVEWEAAGLRLRQLVGLVTIGGHGYAVIATVPSSAFDEYEPLLREMIETVRIDRLEE
jgi:hypothetical protein